jgi:Xaa-Pro aminopeptidase
MTYLVNRRRRAAQIVREAGLDAIAFVPGPNFSYLTGLDFHLMERPTLLFLSADGDLSAIMPELERSKWRDAFPDAETHFWQDSDGYDDAFRLCAETLNGAVGVEGMRMRMFEYQALAQNLPQGTVYNIEPALAGLRMCKEPEEIANLRRAIAISEAALGDLIDSVKVGESEAKLSVRLKQAMLSHGAEGFAFDPLVLSGPNSADPHGSSGGRVTATGRPLLIDFGASFGGMNADITRTFFCQHVGDEFLAIYETVLAANSKGKTTAAPGVTCDTVDRDTTDVLAASPFANMIVHKTGHGLGRDVHEAPQVMIGNTAELKSGAVITIEPGLYRPGEIGVRIEDDVLITDTGAESLTTFSREVTCFG